MSMTHNNEALQKVLVDVNRVTKVVKGGRIFSFAALVVVGDNNGMVGYGTGKAKEVNEASAKGAKEAKNKMIKVYLERGTIPHDVRGDFGATRVFLRKAEPGTGIIAGGPLRVIFACLGVDDIVAKSYGSKNTAALILATFNALSKLYSPKQIAARRGKVLSEIFQS